MKNEEYKNVLIQFYDTAKINNNKHLYQGFVVGYDRAEGGLLFVRMKESGPDIIGGIINTLEYCKKIFSYVSLFNMPFIAGNFVFVNKNRCEIVKFNKDEIEKLIMSLEL